MTAELLAAGWRLHQAGDLPRAEAAYRQLVQQEPDNAQGWFLLGALCQARGDLDTAAASLERALFLQPDHADALHFRGLVFIKKRDLPEAVAHFREALRLRPDDAEIQTNLVLALTHQGEHTEAMALLQAVLRRQPDNLRVQTQVRPLLAQQAAAEGLAHLERGRLTQAVNRLQQCLALRPDFPEAHNNLGQALARQGKRSEAIECFQQALRLRRNFAEALANLGLVYGQQKRLTEAEASCREAVRLRPEMAEAHNNLGVALQEQDRLVEAVHCFRHALELDPVYAEAHSNLGGALWRLGQLEEATVSLRVALRLRPGLVQALNNLGKVLCDQGHYDEALARYTEAVRLEPEAVEVYLGLGNLLKELGRLDEALAAYRAALRCQPDAARVHSTLVLVSHYHPGQDASALLAEARRWDRQHAQTLQHLIQPHPNVPDAGRRLRIGYVSADFCEHPVASFVVPLFAHHDHEHFEIFCYANVVRADAVTDRLRGFADRWRDTRRLSDEQLAALVRQDQVDLLVDLSMHTAGNRLLVFARKPAPVQLTWLAYPGTTGLSAIDYRLTDPYFDPPGRFDGCYAEQSLRLADTFWCYDPLSEPVPIPPLPALHNGYVTFGCLNNFCKVNAGVLAVWARALLAVPRSRLLLLTPRGEAREQVLAHLKRDGIAAERVEFAERQARRAYLAQYGRMDIALDPFPCNGGTTSLDGLWMGVPLVTRVGCTAVGRAGWSQLCNLGLPELAAESDDAYVRRVAELAADLPRRQELRCSLRQRLERSPLMDGPRFARQMERAYRHAWSRWCQGRQP